MQICLLLHHVLGLATELRGPAFIVLTRLVILVVIALIVVWTVVLAPSRVHALGRRDAATAAAVLGIYPLWYLNLRETGLSRKRRSS